MNNFMKRVIEWTYVGALFLIPAGTVIWAQQWGLLIVYGFAGVGFIIVEAWLHFTTGKTITKRMRLLLWEGGWIGKLKAISVCLGLLAFAIMLSTHFLFNTP